MAEEKMPLFAHLEDLRKRIIISLAAIGMAFGFTFYYAEQIFKLLMFPLRYSLDFDILSFTLQFIPIDKLQGTKLVFQEPTEAFFVSMKVAFLAAVIITLPVIFHQLWKFVSPGLHDKEKRYVVPFVLMTTIMFLMGASFCFFMVLPFALSFLLSYNVGDFLMPMLRIGKYMDFCFKFILAFGIIFEIPIIIIFLTRLGIIQIATLKRQRRLTIVLAFVAGAILSPTPDIYNQTLMAVPIILLYELGIWLSVLFSRKEENGDG